MPFSLYISSGVMLDAATGNLRLYCGFDSAIEIFDVHRPGEGTRLLTSPNKKSRDGMKGAFPKTRAITSIYCNLNSNLLLAMCSGPRFILIFSFKIHAHV